MLKVVFKVSRFFDKMSEFLLSGTGGRKVFGIMTD